MDERHGSRSHRHGYDAMESRSIQFVSSLLGAFAVAESGPNRTVEHSCARAVSVHLTPLQAQCAAGSTPIHHGSMELAEQRCVANCWLEEMRRKRNSGVSQSSSLIGLVAFQIIWFCWTKPAREQVGRRSIQFLECWNLSSNTFGLSIRQRSCRHRVGE